MTERVVVVGASVAGIRTAQALRAECFEGDITVIGADVEAPYDKPALSKQFLNGEFEHADLQLLGRQDALHLGIELRLGVAATHLDVAGASVVLGDGSVVSYDACVVATGASARPSPWRARPGIHTLRTIGDSLRLRADLRSGAHVVIIGAGFIGAEVASTARGIGCAVTIIDPLLVPMERALGHEVGEAVARLHADHGVAARFGARVTSIDGEEPPYRVRLDDGCTITASTVVVGIGAVPNDQWLASSGLHVADGLVCDEFCRAEGASTVYAAGDVARWMHRGHEERVRVEHWTNAVEQAQCVAFNITHPDSPRAYEPIEYVWSDQYDCTIQVAGSPSRASHHEVIGKLQPCGERVAVVYSSPSGALVGVVTVNWPRALIRARMLLASGAGFADSVATISALGS